MKFQQRAHFEPVAGRAVIFKSLPGITVTFETLAISFRPAA